MKTWLAYGKEFLHFTLPETLSVDELVLPDVKCSETPADIIARSLDRLIGVDSLASVIEPGKSICLISDDITRPTPVALVLDQLLPRLESFGVRDEDLTILIALGSHRKMTDEELAGKLGANRIGRYRIVQSSFTDDRDFIEVARSSRGNPVLIHRSATDADIRIGIGNIAPHNTLGWSGGAKILFPGIADEASIAEFHMEAAFHPENLFGKVENSVRHEVERWVDSAGLHLIINTVLNRAGQLVDAVAGHFVKAHREGVCLAKKIYGVAFDTPYDLVIIDAEPYSFDFWQGTKGLNAASLLVRDGGVVLLAGPFGEGVGPHPEYPDVMGLRGNREMLQESGDPLAIAVGHMIGRQMRRYETFVYTENHLDAVLEKAGICIVKDIGETITKLVAKRPDLQKAVIVRNGAEILPIGPV
jgi:nickel-dependent lactate racemase